MDTGDAGACDGPQGECQIGCRLKALLGPFLEATADDGGEGRRQFPQLAVELRRLRVQNGVHGFDAGGSLERAASGEHFVKHGAEAENVGAWVDGFGSHLFGRHVSGRAKHGARLGERHGCGVFARCSWSLFSQPEIEDLHLARARDHDIFGLEIAVHDPECVRRSHAIRNLAGEIDGFAHR